MNYKVGDKVWFGVCENRQVQKTCPVCFGKCVVTLILGNDEHVKLECDYCSKGYNEALGYTLEWELVATPELKTITKVNISESFDGDTREYYSDHSMLSREDIFNDKNKAFQRAEEKAAEYARNEAARGNSRKNLSNESYAWKVGYWTRETKKCYKDAERYEKYAGICKGKVKP